MKFEHLYYFGIRDIDQFEYKTIKSNKITVLKNINEICNVCHKYENIHISFDVDSLDPSHMYSTGTRVENGIDLSEIIFLIKYIKDYISSTVNLDIVEYNPNIGSELEKEISKETINLIIDSLF